MLVKKAIFPVAGLGTRFLPATKAQPKEMLPVVDKPLIQYAVEEAYAAGVCQTWPGLWVLLVEAELSIVTVGKPICPKLMLS